MPFLCPLVSSQLHVTAAMYENEADVCDHVLGMVYECASLCVCAAPVLSVECVLKEERF